MAPPLGAKRRLKPKTELIIATIRAPVGMPEMAVDKAPPTYAPKPPRRAEIAVMRVMLSVQNRAAAAGVTRRAKIRTRPTALRPDATIRSMRAVVSRSSKRTGRPSALAPIGSNAEMVNSLNTKKRISNVVAPTAKTSHASPWVMVAAWPRR